MKQKQILWLAIINLLIISTPEILTAQTKKGDWFAEGNLGNINISNDKDESSSGNNSSKTENKIFNASLYPRIGGFINDNVALGTTFNFSYYSNNNNSYYNGVKYNKGKNNESRIGIAPFLRCYFTKNAKSRFYLQLGGGYNTIIFSKGEGTSFQNNGQTTYINKFSSKGHLVSGEALLGFHHFFNDKIAFNSSVGYIYGKRTEKHTYDSTYLGAADETDEFKTTRITGDIAWSFGFTFIIGGKKE